MKDHGYTSFGLLIGFFLPGFAGLFCLRFWSGEVRHWFDELVSSSVALGPLSMITIVSTIVGLEVALCRWVVFELWLCRGFQLDAADFRKLASDGCHDAFRAVIEQHYRYHQFWGGMSIVMPIGLIGWIRQINMTWPNFIAASCLLALTALSWFGAVASFKHYVLRGQAVLHDATDVGSSSQGGDERA